MGFHFSALLGGYSDVDTFADLPDASDNTGEVYLVKTTTGVIFVNRKRAGLYLSDGTSWARMGVIQLAGSSVGYLPSNPPSGKCVITNMYYDPSLEKVTIEKDSEPIS